MKSKESIDFGNLVTWDCDFDVSVNLINENNPSLEVGLVIGSKDDRGNTFYSVFWTGKKINYAWVPKGSIRKYQWH